jgi:hypothetical protein
VDHEEGVVAVTKELVSSRGKPWRELEFFPQVTAVRWISWGGASYTKLRWHRDVQPLGIQHSSVALAPRIRYAVRSDRIGRESRDWLQRHRK